MNPLTLRAWLKSSICLLAVGAFLVQVEPGRAAGPMNPSQVPGYYRIMVGEFEVTALYDGGATIDSGLLRGDREEIDQLLRRSLIDDPKGVPGWVAAYLVNTGSKLVLIDAGAGGHWGGPTLGKLLRNLRAAGYRPEQMDVVLITHLHADHVGGIYNQKSERVFRNADIRMAKADSDFWLSKDIASKAPPDAQIFFEIARNAAAPYLAAKRWKPFEGTDAIVPGIRPYPIRGHTPGHVGYEVSSKGQKLLVWGDVVHISAVQMPRPGVGIDFDVDGPTAIKTRETLFAELAASRTLIAGAHMPFPSFGYLRKDDTGYTWLPVAFRD